MVQLADQQEAAIKPWAVQKRVGLRDARLAMDALLMPVAGLSYIDYRSGVMAHGDTEADPDTAGSHSHMAMRVSPGSTGLSVHVEMGDAIINTQGQGAYMCVLDSVRTLQLSAASASTNRIDLIIARVEDDLNPALSSPSGTRRFTVEVWEGDPSTSTPARPEPTMSDGWKALAAVRVNANTTSITDAMIEDLRGAGLVARGGMRALYGSDAQPGSDAFLEPGAYPGDQRWLHTSGFQHQVYYGATEGWRGVHNCMVYNAYPPPGGEVWVKGYTTTRELCRVTIKDPGTPYMIYPTARAYIMLSPLSSVDVRINLHNPEGSPTNWMRVSNEWRNADQRMVPNVAPIMWGPLEGELDVLLTISNRDLPGRNYGFSYRGNDTGQTLLSVCVYPSTVQPPSP